MSHKFKDLDKKYFIVNQFIQDYLIDFNDIINLQICIFVRLGFVLLWHMKTKRDFKMLKFFFKILY